MNPTAGYEFNFRLRLGGTLVHFIFSSARQTGFACQLIVVTFQKT